MDKIKIGKFIAELRKEKGLTQEQLAEKLNVSNKSISRWENGNTMPDLSLIPLLSEVLDITINELINGGRIEKEDYQKRLEENIILNMDLLKKKIKKILKNFIVIITSIVLLLIVGTISFLIYKESTYKRIYLLEKDIQINVCKQKEWVSVVMRTKDNTPFLFDSYYDQNSNTYIIEKVFKYNDEDNMKDLSSSSTMLFVDDIEFIIYNDKIIYQKGDNLDTCNLDE